jgi:hypothetical protein
MDGWEGIEKKSYSQRKPKISYSGAKQQDLCNLKTWF